MSGQVGTIAQGDGQLVLENSDGPPTSVGADFQFTIFKDRQIVNWETFSREHGSLGIPPILMFDYGRCCAKPVHDLRGSSNRELERRQK
ncbi:hypothetical protein [Bifidobacterium vespertilionis]|uniref:Uncharacterized protein n=1 Tax=Bifidobacterium vespertilionis TaxID=2562524 RepID=A0A5J5DW96_9BIFI|nr:hypothetical protein [Bifidobacterium vespertilionis]KAA8819021.1 hypothetical protein EMO90_08685 [Bifidobacterium vespertilionis]KAA8821198.1 hypothetical protein EM848_11290 [Bifidobacterium vespertilionis]